MKREYERLKAERADILAQEEKNNAACLDDYMDIRGVGEAAPPSAPLMQVQDWTEAKDADNFETNFYVR